MRYNFFDINGNIEDEALKVTIIYIIDSVVDGVENKATGDTNDIVFFDVANKLKNKKIDDIKNINDKRDKVDDFEYIRVCRVSFSFRI